MSTAGADSKLVRALGVWALAAGVVNITIGGGIFRLPSAAAESLGAAAPLAYLACAVVMGLVVVCFAEAASRVPLTGGLYACVEAAFGPFVGFIAGVLLWAALTAASAAVATFFAASLGALVPALASPGARSAIIVLVFALMASVNVAGVRGAGRFNATMTVLKLLPLLLVLVVGLFALDPSRISVTTPVTARAVGSATALLIFAFLGVEAALIPSGEVRDPERTIPRAIFLAIGAVTVIYVGVQLVAQSALGPALPGSPTPVADAASVVLGGDAGRTLILVGSSVSMFGYLGGMTMSVPRMLFAFARDGFLPARLADVHERYRTPHLAIIAQTVLHIALAITGSFEPLAYIANGGALLVYAMCCLATLELRRRNVRAGTGTPFVVPGSSVAPYLALVAVVALISQLPRGELVAVAGVGVAAAALYAVTRGLRANRQPPERA
jgi:APA family basic amino acid/polyamine antiporter